MFICTSLPFLIILYFVFICNSSLSYVLCYVDLKKNKIRTTLMNDLKILVTLFMH